MIAVYVAFVLATLPSSFMMSGCGTCVQVSFSAPGPNVTGWNLAIDIEGYAVEELWFVHDVPFQFQSWHMDDNVLIVSGITCPGVQGDEWLVVQFKLSGHGGPIRFLGDGPGGTGTRSLQGCWVVVPPVITNVYYPSLAPNGGCECSDPNT